MTLQEAYEKRRQEVLALQRQVKKFQKDLELAAAGLYAPDEKISLLKQINHLSHELRNAEKERDRYQELWNLERARNMYDDFSKMDLAEENAFLREENTALKAEIESLKGRVAFLEENGGQESAAKIQALSDEVCRLTSILNNDSANSGTPTSKTPLNKNKVIPNLREKSGKQKGGQPGHEQHTLSSIPEGEETATEDHSLDACPYCGGGLEEVGYDEKDELDYEVHVVKKRHLFHKYRCRICGKESRAPVPNRLKEKCQYGGSLQAMILALLDLGFVSVNRVKRLLRGFFSGQLDPCEAFIIGMQKKAAKKLKNFAAEVKRMLAMESILYWDDTVIFIDRSRSCMRFYGTEKLALFTAHESKGRKSIDEDGLLELLGAHTYVMHDHVTMNYNADFIFINIECNQHLQRDLQKLSEVSGHEWPFLLKSLISSTIHERKQKQKARENAFSHEYIQAFQARIDELLEMGDKEYEKDHSRYYEEDERRLLARLRKFRENYFMWVTDFRLPTTNNLSERSLRFTKIHEKVSGQFESVEYARYFASIRTYLETCARNGINEYTALLRLTQDNPFSLSEVLSYSGSL